MLSSHGRAGEGSGLGSNTSKAGAREARRLRVKRGAVVALAAASALVNVPGARAETPGSTTAWDLSMGWELSPSPAAAVAAEPVAADAPGVNATYYNFANNPGRAGPTSRRTCCC